MQKLLVFLATAGISMAAVAVPETYVIDGTHFFPRFEYSHLGYSTQYSRFDSANGKIVLDREARAGSVDVEIDAKSVDTGFRAFNTDIQGEDYLDTVKYPTITYKSTRLNFEGEKLVSVDGSLTIKGISKPVTLTVTSFRCATHPMLKRDACGANATAKINRSTFNAGKFVPYVGDEVTLTFAIEAIRQD